MGYPKIIVQLLISYMEGRKFRVKVGNEFSTYRRQGSVLSLHLYLIHTADIPMSNYPLDLTIITLYADDTVIFYQSWNLDLVMIRLQEHANKLNE